MREILFRGKRKDNDNPWIYGHLHKMDGYGTGYTEYGIQVQDIPTSRPWSVLVIPESVGQFTGLTDKNGKKIFEGDICRFREWSKGDMCWIGKVHYEHQQFVISGHKNKECESDFLLVLSRFIHANIEVIGNIYDNPELMERSENAIT